MTFFSGSVSLCFCLRGLGGSKFSCPSPCRLELIAFKNDWPFSGPLPHPGEALDGGHGGRGFLSLYPEGLVSQPQQRPLCGFAPR